MHRDEDVVEGQVEGSGRGGEGEGLVAGAGEGGFVVGGDAGGGEDGEADGVARVDAEDLVAGAGDGLVAAALDEGDAGEHAVGLGVARVGLQGGLGGLAGGGEAELLEVREGHAGERVGLPGVAREDHVVGVGGLAGGVLLAEHGAAQEQHAVLDDEARLGAGGGGR
ncbi:hypothetical protein [Nannocystis sp.]|uniref:hypothetical protein n=1 Tax=Nannocystis sp. TaxID=1962667 RepID=UPI0025D63BEF|nr:hypothetical protein [Nannocystis sp.]MBK7825369.1 hypothetical protein [Nannocystis sp.]